jgi:hypothetical protein
VFPHLNQGNEHQRVEIVNINFAVWRDSTSLEAKIREIFEVPGSAESGNLQFRAINGLVNAGFLCNGAW